MCQGTGQVKSIEALALSVVRRIKGVLSREGVAEMRVKLAPAIAMTVLNQKRRDLAELEAQHEASLQILADPLVAYGEMQAEIERRDEDAAEKPVPRPERERERARAEAEARVAEAEEAAGAARDEHRALAAAVADLEADLERARRRLQVAAERLGDAEDDLADAERQLRRLR